MVCLDSVKTADSPVGGAAGALRAVRMPYGEEDMACHGPHEVQHDYCACAHGIFSVAIPAREPLPPAPPHTGAGAPSHHESLRVGVCLRSGSLDCTARGIVPGRLDV